MTRVSNDSSNDHTLIKSEEPPGPSTSTEEKPVSSTISIVTSEVKTEPEVKPIKPTVPIVKEDIKVIRRIMIDEVPEKPGRLLRTRTYQDYLDEVSSMSSQSSLISSSVCSDSTFSPGYSSRNSPAYSTSSCESLSEPVILKICEENGVILKREDPKTNASNVTGDVNSLSLKSFASNDNDDTIILSAGGDFGRASRKSDFEKTIVISTKSELLPVPRETLHVAHDRTNILEPNMNPAYMQDIFCYLKDREVGRNCGSSFREYFL